MKRYYYFGFGIIITMLLVSMFIANINKSTPISKEEAEKTALSQAEKDGYKDAKIWTRFNAQTHTRLIFSPEENRDIEVWQVNIDAAYNPQVKNAPAASYYISKKDGSIISVIKGLTQAGMDLEISGTEQDGEEYHFNIKNNGNIDYVIEWIEPFFDPQKQSNIQREIRKVEIKKKIPVNSELSVSGVLELPEVDKDFIIGFMIKVGKENESTLIFDDKYRNGY
ncbi:hypothetical protein P4H66_28800 [Paenibacillus dokdonensis]|uniref:Uncharacterized protein n=2 Tax=Paenibacillus dokdonensis TaxID=2567944 RepID=A0ABU6GVS8_9BACL|nr:hypothetical protein [Paenibacillus dokdonensis]MEC0243813.1 hypothetical protein [Paenibacillus dokdonensis]